MNWIDFLSVHEEQGSTKGNPKVMLSNINDYQLMSNKVSFRGGRGGICPTLGFGLPSLGYAENSILHTYRSFNDTVNGKLWLCKNSPRFHQIVSNKTSKIKISRGACPRTPPVCHMLCTWIHTCLPNNPYNLILPRPSKGSTTSCSWRACFFHLMLVDK